jgi:hypothetical protein
MIFLPILALFSLMIADSILGRNRIHSLSPLFSVIDFAYTVTVTFPIKEHIVNSTRV